MKVVRFDLHYLIHHRFNTRKSDLRINNEKHEYLIYSCTQAIIVFSIYQMAPEIKVVI